MLLSVPVKEPVPVKSWYWTIASLQESLNKSFVPFNIMSTLLQLGWEVFKLFRKTITLSWLWKFPNSYWLNLKLTAFWWLNVPDSLMLSSALLVVIHLFVIHHFFSFIGIALFSSTTLRFFYLWKLIVNIILSPSVYPLICFTAKISNVNEFEVRNVTNLWSEK